MITNELTEYRNFLSWLSKLYWVAPTKESIIGFALLATDAVAVNHNDIQSIRKIVQDLDDVAAKEVAVDYTNLFCGFKARAPFPYESIYRGSQRILMQEPYHEVKREFEANGFTPDQSISNEPDDHITFELEYLVFLLDKLIQAVTQNDEKMIAEITEQKTAFMNKHLTPWVPLFCKDVYGQADTDFYKLVASLTEQVVVSAAQL